MGAAGCAIGFRNLWLMRRIEAAGKWSKLDRSFGRVEAVRSKLSEVRDLEANYRRLAVGSSNARDLQRWRWRCNKSHSLPPNSDGLGGFLKKMRGAACCPL